MKPFTSSNGGWNRDRILPASRCHSCKHVSFQPSYMWEQPSPGLGTVNYLQFGLIVNTK